ncbi:uncharacterized protein THITE_2112167 [Thermothielavioides terrestris NRRL 8126]|uniref:A to I editase domain-containing protein n=1 Tax=Thermothielavioides terrestris (strain ATCC 38088 / NRRL 8126) TaxID=578455 RepID=G2R532_THETT|nr:uncharacterized protein THITE_2112167 [Thermothielavioides terrestris NRRL 8126]AEO65309.1 hypothetical protein THITE_2112167 [Thermothielavioides terrestris NRRL 8126]
MAVDVDADAIASAVLDEFRKLPAKRKPAVRDNGLREWVPMSGIVVKGPDFLKCVALATGMKCLPASKLAQANGVALHDWHAEVLAIRAFNRFLLDECRRLAQDSTYESEFLRRRTREELATNAGTLTGPWHRQPFAWREELTLHMYCSEAPCGDASMELVMSSQPDATPWTIPASLSPAPSPTPPPPPNTVTTTTTESLLPTTTPTPAPTQPATTTTSTPLLLGRGYFSRLGIVRRKPARPDSPPTLSKSCSDKLALKQCASLLGALAALLVSPRGAYLATLVLPAAQYDAGACRRCFGGGAGVAGAGPDSNSSGGGGGLGGGGGGSGDTKAAAGRMAAVSGRVWDGTGYGFVPLRVVTTKKEFEFSRRSLTAAANGGGEIKLAASNLAVAWTRNGEVEEGLIGGVLQGRKAFDVKGASLTSRRKMWAAAVEVAAALGDEEIARALGKDTYDGVKEGPLLASRRIVKQEVREEALKGWQRNVGDGNFHL